MLNTMSAETKLKIVKDLLLRKPKGEKGQKPTYYIEELWCYASSKNKKYVKCNHEGWGYTDETIWDLGFRSESDVRDYVFNNFYKTEHEYSEYCLTSGRRGGISRKTRRIFQRIAPAVRRVHQDGSIQGLYKVRINWSTEFFFFGSSVKEIQTLAKTMLSPVYPEGEFSVSFFGRSLPGDILDKNVASFGNHEKKISQIREEASRAIKRADQMKSQLDYVKTLITQNLEVAMRAN